MPVGAGDEALGRIEAALAAEDPALVESFHRWGTTPAEPVSAAPASSAGRPV